MNETPRWVESAVERGWLPRWNERRWATALGIAAALVFVGYWQVLDHAVERAQRLHQMQETRAHLSQRCFALTDLAARQACRERAAAGIVPPEPPVALADSRS
ncbi:MAG TPA: hypothetical protein VNO84_08320 [Burkholderiaceae bacterium]|nr:hypothetical protein [Burkholderiaceae bacterium]